MEMGIINIKTYVMLQKSLFVTLFVKYLLNYEETDEYKLKKPPQNRSGFSFIYR